MNCGMNVKCPRLGGEKKKILPVVFPYTVLGKNINAMDTHSIHQEKTTWLIHIMLRPGFTNCSSQFACFQPGRCIEPVCIVLASVDTVLNIPALVCVFDWSKDKFPCLVDVERTFNLGEFGDYLSGCLRWFIGTDSKCVDFLCPFWELFRPLFPFIEETTDA